MIEGFHLRVHIRIDEIHHRKIRTAQFGFFLFSSDVLYIFSAAELDAIQIIAIGRLTLSYAQAVDMLISLSVTKQIQEIKTTYRAENGAVTKRVIQPHYLLLSCPFWYVLAWDHLRGEVRTFSCDRIEQITALEAEFPLRPLADFQAAIEGAQVI